ncbi:MAG: hypothetical protein AAGD32_00870 [Planctomycetota bacterium]
MFHTRAIPWVIFGMILCVLASGCEETESELGWIDLTETRVDQHTIEVFTQLQAGPASVAAGTDGTLYFSVRGDGRDDAVYAVRSKGIPRTVGLDVNAALRAAGLDDGAGHFKALLPTPEGLVYYFSGGTKRASADHLGLLPTGTQTPTVLARAGRLGDISGLGGTIVLAEPALVGNDTTATLLLRTPGDAALVQFDLRDLRRPDNAVRFGQLRLPIIGPFGKLTLREPELSIGAADDRDRLLVTDPAGKVYNVNFASGRGRTVAELTTLPSPIPPAQQVNADQTGNWAVIYAPPLSWQEIVPGTEQVAGTPKVWLVNGDRHDGTFIEARQFEAGRFFPTSMLRVDDTTYLLHDPQTGAVAKLTVLLPEGLADENPDG